MAEKTAIPDDIKDMSFEVALKELKGIVDRLEKGEEKLDQAIEAYERGALLKQHCEQKLQEAQKKIEKISFGPDGEPRTEPLDVDS